MACLIGHKLAPTVENVNGQFKAKSAARLWFLAALSGINFCLASSPARFPNQFPFRTRMNTNFQRRKQRKPRDRIMTEQNHIFWGITRTLVLEKMWIGGLGCEWVHCEKFNLMFWC